MMKVLILILGIVTFPGAYGRHSMIEIMNDDDFHKDAFSNFMIRYRPQFFEKLATNFKGTILNSTTASSVNMGKDLKYSIMNDEDIFRKQKFILDITRNIYSTPKLHDIKYIRFEESNNKYMNHTYVTPFFELYKSKCFLPRGRTFTISNIVHRNQAVALFNLFYYSKDFDTFRKNVLWSRYYINEDMFIYCLSVTIIHRRDLLGIKIPAFFEIFPQKFHTEVTRRKAIARWWSDHQHDQVIVQNVYTSDLSMMNEESKLAYFTEDISWNQFHFILHIGYPYWLGGDVFGLNRQRRGERYLYLIQQMLARYSMERLSHGMGDIEDISFAAPVKTGYNSHLSHNNGQDFSTRKNYYEVLNSDSYHLISQILDYESRIRDVIDSGYVVGKNNEKIDLNTPNGIDILGNLIQSNKDSANDRSYGNLVQLMLTLFGGGYVKNNDYKNVFPSTMDHFETAFRDPTTYQVYKRILTLYYQYKNQLSPYTEGELLLKGVRLLDVQVSKLVTFFDDFDVDISNMVNNDIPPSNGKEQITIARHSRLNHKPFIVSIQVNSYSVQQVIVRLFLGPKFDQFENIFNIDVSRNYFLELDKFIFDLPVGTVTIQRNSQDFKYNVRDRTTFMDLYRKILWTQDRDMLLKLNIEESHCGFPDRLLLPRGWVDGMPMQLFVIISNATNHNKGPSFMTKCGWSSAMFGLDNHQLGFPFDRRIDESQFYTANTMFKDIRIYHEGRARI